MKKLTAEVAKMELANLKAMKENPSFGISIKAELFMQALEISLPLLEKKESNPQIDNDGWIEWRGGDCPVANGTKVEVRFRNGNEAQREAGLYSWTNNLASFDIIAYRVIVNDGREG